MPSFAVHMVYEKVVTFYVEAPSKGHVEAFLDENEEWHPRDVPGLVEDVEEEESGFHVDAVDGVVANFRINDVFDLEEIES